MRALRRTGDPKKVTVPSWYVDLADEINTTGRTPTPTRADSLFLLNNNREIEKLVARGYTKAPAASYDASTIQSGPFYVSQVDSAIDFRGDEAKQGDINQPADSYMDFSNPPFVGSSDWMIGGEDDYGMPMHYLHPSIVPQSTRDLQPPAGSSDPYVYTHSYDDIMITPFDMLSSDQKNERVKMAMSSNNLGGLPPSIVSKINKGFTPYFKTIKFNSTSTQLPPEDMTAIPSRSPANISSDTPEAVIQRSLVPMQGKGRQPQTMYRFAPSLSTNQYPVGERYYDEEKNRWQNDPWSRDEQRASKEYYKDRGREQYRRITTPKF